MNRIRPNKIERIACYIRVSTQEQKLHGLSLDAQKQKLEQYAKKHNLKIVEWYLDEGVSGRKLISRRPELQRMIQDAENGNFDRIIFIKLDRFFRSVAEYHECMKRIAPVLWTATEEEYDLTTANGRMLVNMKLTVAELEADQTGERIKIVNEYKASTGQPLVGTHCLPFGYMVEKDEATGRKKVIKNPDEAPILEDLIERFLTHQSRRSLVTYLHAKHHVHMSYNTVCNLLQNTMLYGTYRDNPNYCEPYITKETYDRIQQIGKINIKDNTVNRAYIFSGLIVCPVCGCRLAGNWTTNKKPDGRTYNYKKYRCAGFRLNDNCTFNKSVSENVIEKHLLKNMAQYLADAKITSVKVTDGEPQAPKYDIEAIHEEIDRLNYSWQKGMIRKVEQYEEQHTKLMEKLEKAEAEQGEVSVKDFSKVESILQEGWENIYKNLDDTYKRAFWRSFIKSIELNWTTDVKEITKVNFF